MKRRIPNNDDSQVESDKRTKLEEECSSSESEVEDVSDIQYVKGFLITELYSSDKAAHFCVRCKHENRRIPNRFRSCFHSQEFIFASSGDIEIDKSHIRQFYMHWFNELLFIREYPITESCFKKFILGKSKYNDETTDMFKGKLEIDLKLGQWVIRSDIKLDELVELAQTWEEKRHSLGTSRFSYGACDGLPFLNYRIDCNLVDNDKIKQFEPFMESRIRKTASPKREGSMFLLCPSKQTISVIPLNFPAWCFKPEEKKVNKHSRFDSELLYTPQPDEEAMIQQVSPGWSIFYYDFQNEIRDIVGKNDLASNLVGHDVLHRVLIIPNTHIA